MNILLCLCPNIFVSGNDDQDVKYLNRAGLSAVPLDAPVPLNAAKYSCNCTAGRGAVREFAEHILRLKKNTMSQDGNCTYEDCPIDNRCE